MVLDLCTQRTGCSKPNRRCRFDASIWSTQGKRLKTFHRFPGSPVPRLHSNPSPNPILMLFLTFSREPGSNGQNRLMRLPLHSERVDPIVLKRHHRRRSHSADEVKVEGQCR